MQNDLTMIRVCFEDRKDITICPIADVHLGSAEFDEKKFVDILKYIKSEQNIRVVLAGDLLNNSTRSSIANVFQETMRPMKQKERMIELLEPIKDRILCAVSGNHERRSGKDADNDPTYDIMRCLGKQDVYRENMSFLHIQMGNAKNNGETNPAYMVGITHGAGGGSTIGASVNRSEKFAWAIEGLDVLITGHTHKPSVAPTYRLVTDPRTGKVYLRKTYVVVCSSWLNYGGYAMEKMMPPCGNVIQKITLGGKKKSIEVIM